MFISELVIQYDYIEKAVQIKRYKIDMCDIFCDTWMNSTCYKYILNCTDQCTEKIIMQKKNQGKDYDILRRK